jgi:hypothetical protein
MQSIFPSKLLKIGKKSATMPILGKMPNHEGIEEGMSGMSAGKMH